MKHIKISRYEDSSREFEKSLNSTNARVYGSHWGTLQHSQTAQLIDEALKKIKKESAAK